MDKLKFDSCYLRIGETLLLATILNKRDGLCSTDILLCWNHILTATPTIEVSNIENTIPLPIYINPTNVINMWNYGVTDSKSSNFDLADWLPVTS